jgi:hypothetical protein
LSRERSKFGQKSIEPVDTLLLDRAPALRWPAVADAPVLERDEPVELGKLGLR